MVRKFWIGVVALAVIAYTSSLAACAMHAVTASVDIANILEGQGNGNSNLQVQTSDVNVNGATAKRTVVKAGNVEISITPKWGQYGWGTFEAGQAQAGVADRSALDISIKIGNQIVSEIFMGGDQGSWNGYAEGGYQVNLGAWLKDNLNVPEAEEESFYG